PGAGAGGLPDPRAGRGADGDRGRRRLAAGGPRDIRDRGRREAGVRGRARAEVVPVSGGIRLDGRVAVVTGSGRRLGRAYALALAAAGGAVWVNDVDGGAATQPVDDIVAAGGRATAVVAPVGPTETAQAL